MIRFLLAIVLAATLCQAEAIATPLQLLTGLPSQYVPGEPVTFEVRLPEVSNLGSYNIDVVLQGDAGIAGLDYFFDLAATVPAPLNYVFGTAANFFGAANDDSPKATRLTLTDFSFSGVDVLNGGNDRAATVALRTSPTFGGQLSVLVDAQLLILDTPGMSPYPVSGFGEIQMNIAEAGALQMNAVPEPSNLVIGIMVLVTTPSGRLLTHCFRSRLR